MDNKRKRLAIDDNERVHKKSKNLIPTGKYTVYTLTSPWFRNYIFTVPKFILQRENRAIVGVANLIKYLT